ncbi:MAG: AI-2E family transporter [Candidatus Thiosymbion ectosymbiont of Robbea hypermnestra]|nr:AI-2E family transporter [Candidatus Thiosymbion ectosymbiont of Robbea hypermnestra]
MATQVEFSPAARFLLIAGAFVLVVAGMHAAASLVAPFLLAGFLAVIVAPAMFSLVHRGTPAWLALLAVSIVMIAIGGLIVALVSGSLNAFMANLPEYQSKLKGLTPELNAWLEGLGIEIPRAALIDYLNAGKAMEMAGVLLGGLGDLLTNAFLIILTVIFILLEASNLPAKLRVGLQASDFSLERLHSVLDNINRYMVLKTLLSLFTGGLIWGWLWYLGLDFAPLWALVTFLLNFVPTIGSIIAAIPAVLLALIQLDVQAALWVALGYLVVNAVVGTVIEPRFMGRGLGLSTLVVFVSLVFWGWVLGPVGMFLAVPLTMVLKIALDADPQTRPIAILLGPELQAPPPPAHREEKAIDNTIR